jgi:hypothetical protein
MASSCSFLLRSTSVSSMRRMKLAPVRFGEQPIDQGDASIADMQAPGRAGGETDGNSHRAVSV